MVAFVICTDLLHTPQKSPVSYTKHISESLGAQIHPDISWTSSLNTPPAVPSTLILCKQKAQLVVIKIHACDFLDNNCLPNVTAKPDESPCPVSVSEDKNSESVWRQKLPNAIEDGEIHSTVASALDGAENVLSIFFTNSSSALRKVKTDNKGSKRKRLVQPNNCTAVKTDDQEPVKCSSTQPVQNGDIGITQWSPLSLSEIPACSVNTSYHDKCPAQVKIEQLQSDSEFGQPVRLPLTITDSGFTNKKRKFVYTVETSKTQVQEKEIQPQKRSFSRHKVSIKQLGKSQNEAGVGRNEIEKQENITDLDMSQLCRDFAQDFSQMSNQGNLSEVTEDTPQNDFSSSACLLAIKRTKQEARQANLHQDCDGISNRGHVSATNQNYSINEGTVSDSGFQSAVADITNLTTILCGPPSLENSGQSQQWSGIKTDIHGTASFLSSDKGNGKIDLHNSQETGTMASQTMSHDRVSELHMESTSTNLPNSGKGSAHGINFIPLSYQMNGGFPEKTTVSSVSASGFKTASNKDIAISSVNLERAKHLFEDSEAEKTFSDQPTQSIHDTKDEFTMNYGSVKNIVSNSNRPFSSTEKFGDVTCQLTASQKADVTELCTLLEEADSQFEFTQFKTTPLKHCQDNATSFQKDGKDLDPDFLKGINFDDSFSSDAEKQQTTTVNPEKITSAPSLLYTTSNNTDSSATNELSKRGGFCTASGKKVFVSADAMKKAECLLHEIYGLEDTNKEQKQKADALTTDKHSSQIPFVPPKSCGFQTASGKGVVISSAALRKAQSLLNECEASQDKMVVKSACSKMPVSGPSSRNSGFFSGSGKPVAFSAEALQKAKVLFSDISFSAEIPAGSDTRTSDKKQDSTGKMDKINCGFMTAGGTAVHVSQKNLLKAKNLLNEFNGLDSKAMQDTDAFFKECDSNNGFSVSETSVAPVGESDSKRRNLSKFEFDNEKARPTVNHENMQQNDNVDIFKGVFKSTPESVNPVSLPGNSSLTAKSSQLSTTLKNVAPSTFSESGSAGGFCTASGKKVSVSDDALTKAKSLLNESGVFEVTDILKQNKDTLPSHSDGFQTASGKGIAISFAALTKAKTLLSEYEDVHKISVPCPPPRNSGCHSTSDKSDVFSSEAHQMAKSLFSDICINAEVPGVSDSKTSSKHKHAQNNVEEIMCGFRTAGGAKVHVSQKNLFKAKNLLKELAGEDCCDLSAYSASSHDAHKSDLVKMIDLKRTSDTNLGTANDEDMPATECAPQTVKSVLSLNETDHENDTPQNPGAHGCIPTQDKSLTDAFKWKQDKTALSWVNKCDNPGEEMPSVLYNEVNHNLSSEGPDINKTAGSSVPVCQSLNLSECTDTQQKFLAQEALDCTKALLEDEGLAGHSLLMTLGNVPMQDNPNEQKRRIRKKRRQTIRPLPGSLFLTKTSGVLRISLRAAVNGKLPARYTQKQMYTYGVQQHVSDITSETAETFRFNLQQFLNPKAFVENGGVQLADGGWLICSSDWTAGKEEFYRALCDTPGVDPKLISEEWVYNHYRWIVWKQASMERAFPETMGSLCLTPEQVLLQLKYRYDVEVDHSHRSALKKIMEKDDTAAKTLVLCVCGVVSRGHSPNRQRRDDTKTLQGSDGKVENLFAVVWLTDGWYAIKTLLDEPLTAMLHKGRLAVGGKLIIHGAQLVGSNDACSPLEAPDSLMLKICANSSRPARWDSKLGFHRDPRPFLLPISSLYSNGGPVGCVDIVILRSYPIQWMERKPDGGIVFRSIRAEEKEARRYNSHKQKAIEILFAKIQAEFEEEEKGNYKPHRRRQTISDQDIANLQDGEELYEAVGDDPAYLEAHLSEQQLATLHTYRCALMEKKQAELQDRYRRALEAQNDKGSCPKRDVTPVWRLCIADSMDQHGSVYRLNLWRPSSDLQALLKEGCRYKVYNLTTSDGKKCSGIETVQLTGTKKTQFQDLLASEEWLSARFQPRVATNFVDLQNPDFQSLCGEVDLTGYVISIIDGLNFVKVRCFNSLSQSGLEDVVKPRVLLALSNLQLRGQATSPTPVVFAGDLTVFSTNPKEVHLQESLSQLRNLIQVRC
uniref:Tower domain-containing protein n=1 Tax=Mastacembelus armatus TaxID=205130 RepID=A0A7N8XE67_9TELE